MGSPKCEDQESKAARDLILQAASSRITKDGLVVPFAAASAASPARNLWSRDRSLDNDRKHGGREISGCRCVPGRWLGPLLTNGKALAVAGRRVPDMGW